MNLLEHELEYPLGDRLPEPAEKLEVAPGIYWVRMPLPFALNHINLYLCRDRIRGEDCWTLVDCGICSDETKALWERIFADTAHGLEGLPIRRVLCTHGHPDHIGLAHWIVPRFDAMLWITHGEVSITRFFSKTSSTGESVEDTIRFFHTNGIEDQTVLEAIRRRNSKYFSGLVPDVPRQFHRLRTDEPVEIGGRVYQVIIGTGHSPEHASLYCERDGILFSGDMVLPRISTNVSVWESEPESDPVNWYLRSLDDYRNCRHDTRVLPSHGRPFHKLHRRIEQQREHHAERLTIVHKACEEKPMSANEVIPALFGRTFDVHQTTFALGEALAHLHALWYRGQLERRVSANGVVRFSAC